ncbi:hypothetical protein TKK_0013859 [Trichogramma kaykai]
MAAARTQPQRAEHDEFVEAARGCRRRAEHDEFVETARGCRRRAENSSELTACRCRCAGGVLVAQHRVAVADAPVESLSLNTAWQLPMRRWSPEKSFRSLKVDLQNAANNRRIRKKLYETLKFIRGPNYRLAAASEYENKNTNLGK